MTIEVSCPACGKTLQAKDSAAGKQAKCPGCGGIISIPEAVLDTVDEVQEFDQGFDADFDYAAAEQQGPSSPSEQSRRPCPQCGEMIVSGAAKCRFCGEIFDLRLKRQQSQTGISNADKNLSGGEWVVAIVCSFVGCIVGIVYMIQGKPKGLKMIGVSLAATVFWNIINAVLQLAIQGQGF